MRIRFRRRRSAKLATANPEAEMFVSIFRPSQHVSMQRKQKNMQTKYTPAYDKSIKSI